MLYDVANQKISIEEQEEMEMDIEGERERILYTRWKL